MLTYGFGGANIISTPADLALFARALLTGSLLTQSSLNQMKTIVPNSASYWAGYGLGIHHALSYASADMFGHDGYYTNLSDMFHSNDFGFTLVTMNNTQTQPFGMFNQMYNALRTYIKTVGMQEKTLSSSFHIFPNPVSGNLFIDMQIIRHEAQITIMTLDGKILFKNIQRDIQHLEIDTRSIPVGVYMIQVQGENFIKQKKLIVSN
ncbi:hypothetical protein CNR22_00420 [Sphingobacteriaceae bacterium]|nr:hypothetical protein CNR22_00420 [Sphingobacteriaceae bacterium]